MVYGHYENSSKEINHQNNLIEKIVPKGIDLFTTFYCEKCGKQNQFFHEYCFNCGASLREAKDKFKNILLLESDQSKTTTCPECNNKINSNYKYCEHCGTELKYNSRYIPKHVKKIVWLRDEGHCVECGSSCDLQFDHIIPLSKGGANTVKNLQLLCAKCNRKKCDKIDG